MNVKVLDLSGLNQDILNKINSGEYFISNTGGVVRNSSGSIVKHVPWKEISCSPTENISSLISQIQTSIGVASALSTAVVVGAIIVSTKIILNRLEKIESLVRKILKELNDQNQFQYFLQLRDYIAISESLKEVVFSLGENKDLALMKLNELAIKRKSVILTSLERIYQIENLTSEHQQIVVNFLNQAILLLPKIYYFEKDVAIALGRVNYAKSIKESFLYDYLKLEARYKKYLNCEYKALLKGGNTIYSDLLLKNIEHFNKEGEINKYLLELKS